jgi:hypothetical protein
VVSKTSLTVTRAGGDPRSAQAAVCPHRRALDVP